MRAEGERYSSCWVKETWEYFILLPELNRIEGLTILVCLELERFLRWFLAVLSLNRNESGGRKVQQLLGQTDLGILHFDNRIEGLTILVCLELEQFLRWFLSGSRNESGGRKVQQLLGQTDKGILHFVTRIEQN